MTRERKGVRLVPVRGRNLEPDTPVDGADLRRQRAVIEDANSPLVAWKGERLRTQAL